MIIIKPILQRWLLAKHNILPYDGTRIISTYRIDLDLYIYIEEKVFARSLFFSTNVLS